MVMASDCLKNQCWSLDDNSLVANEINEWWHILIQPIILVNLGVVRRISKGKRRCWAHVWGTRSSLLLGCERALSGKGPERVHNLGAIEGAGILGWDKIILEHQRNME